MVTIEIHSKRKKHYKLQNESFGIFFFHLTSLRIFNQCTMCTLSSMFSFQPNKLRHILKFMSWYTIEHIFVPACSVGRKTWFLRKPWFSNSKFAISGLFFPILSALKIMFPVPENMATEYRSNSPSLELYTFLWQIWYICKNDLRLNDVSVYAALDLDEKVGDRRELVSHCLIWNLPFCKSISL